MAEAGFISNCSVRNADSVWLTAWERNKAGCRVIDRHPARSSRGVWQRTAGDDSLNMAVFILSLTLKKISWTPPARRLSSIHATIRVGKAEMLERALSLWMYVTPACPVTLSASDVFKQGRSGLQSRASSSDQAQRPICRLKRLCLLLSNRFFTISCSKLYSSRCVHF